MNTQTVKKPRDFVSKYVGKPAENAIALKLARDIVKQANVNSPNCKVRCFCDDDVAKIKATILDAIHAWDGMYCRNAAALIGERDEITLVQAVTREYNLSYRKSGYTYTGDSVVITLRCRDHFRWSLSRKTVKHDRKIVIDKVFVTRY